MTSKAALAAALLVAGLRGGALERRCFSLILAAALDDRTQPLLQRLGLSAPMMRLFLAAYFPDFSIVVPNNAGSGDLAVEEEDLRQLLLKHRVNGRPECDWLAAIVARRAQGTNHLWEDLGLSCRDDLNDLMRHYFPSLVALNRDDMKWKKFLYRLMCEEEGFKVCKSPSCALCGDVELCFEPGSRVLMGKTG